MVVTFLPRRDGGCNGCPLLLYDAYGQEPELCQADKKLMVARKGAIPDKCPLRDDAYVVKLVVRQSASLPQTPGLSSKGGAENA